MKLTILERGINMVKIAPSVLSLDFTKFSEQMLEVNKSSDWIHFDVMDGHFVPNISYGPIILENIKKVSDLFCDVHIMVEEPRKFSEWFIDAGADQITFHIEAVTDIAAAKELITYIKSRDVKVGISIKPGTPVTAISEVLADLDLVLIMSVEPGFGGQKFIPETLVKVEDLVNLRADNDYSYLIEIDGGINGETGKLAKAAGVDVLVAGSYVFNGDIAQRVNSLK